MRATQRLGYGERLVGVDHQLELVADRFAHRGEPPDVLGDRRFADLDLGALESRRLRRDRFVDELLRGMMQPAAFGRVHGDRRLRAAGHFPQRLPRAPALQVPQRGVDRSEREAGDRADCRRVRMEKQFLP